MRSTGALHAPRHDPPQMGNFGTATASPLFGYGCMKSLQHVSDAGAIPAASTTTGATSFDGASSRDGQPAMVPAVTGSASVCGRPCDGPNPKLPMTTAIKWLAPLDVLAGQGVTKAGTLSAPVAQTEEHA